MCAWRGRVEESLGAGLGLWMGESMAETFASSFTFRALLTRDGGTS